MIAPLFLQLRIGITSVAILWSVLLIGACKGDPDADGDGFVASEDCNDEDPRIRPSATEQCNAIDDDCDGDIDEGVLLHYKRDADGDGYGTEEEVMACSGTPNTASNTFDCDDSDPDVHPKVTEICANGKDDDCDGQEAAMQTWYADADGDGFGDPATTVEDCDAPTGFTADSSDCDDGDAAVHPGVEERCDNAIDDDCDDVVASSADKDADGWYADACVSGSDCDDGDATIHPDAVETPCDGIDSACDGGEGECIMSLSSADAEYTGEDYEGWAGWPGEVAAAGNVNGDDYDDFLVGTGFADAAYLVLGGPSPASGSLSTADAKYTGEGNVAGRSVAGAGDVDGDGYDDLLVGGAVFDGEAAENAGAAYLVLGGPSPASISLSTADAKYTGEADSDYAGYVAGAGNVNGDAHADILVLAFYNDDGGSDAGAAYLVLGSDSPSSMSLSNADVEYTGVGYAEGGAAAGDVNGDGHSDILAGSDGSVYLVLGGPSPASAPISSADAEYTGFGPSTLAVGGDIDGDGYNDILLGALGNNDGGLSAGAAFLLLGSESPDSRSLGDADAKYTGTADGDQAGESVAAAGDVDADGYDEILVGAGRNDDGGTDAGAAYLVLGGPSPASASLSASDAEYIGEAPGDFAYAVSGAGDVDADGYDDVLVGAVCNSDGGFQAGAAYLVLRGGL